MIFSFSLSFYIHLFMVWFIGWSASCLFCWFLPHKWCFLNSNTNMPHGCLKIIRCPWFFTKSPLPSFHIPWPPRSGAVFPFKFVCLPLPTSDWARVSVVPRGSWNHAYSLWDSEAVHSLPHPAQKMIFTPVLSFRPCSNIWKAFLIF